MTSKAQILHNLIPHESLTYPLLSTITNAIQASAEKNALLLHEIADPDYAQSALEQSTLCIQDLSHQKEEAQKKLALPTKKMEREREGHFHLQQSTTCKWANKLVGCGDKFGEQVTHEEQ
jgi:hypothetical protein